MNMGGSLDSKERVKAALSFQEPDRPPCGFYAIDHDTVEKIIGRPTYVRNKAKTRKALWEGRRDEVVQSYIEDSIDLFEKLSDVVDIINLFTELYPVLPPKGWKDPDPPKQIDDYTWKDSQGRTYKYSEHTADITLVHDPNQFTREFSESDFPLDFEGEGEDESIYEALDPIVERFKDRKFILGPFPLAKELLLLGGFERGLQEMAVAPELVDRAVESAIARSEALQRHWHNRGYDGLFAGEDFAYNDGPFMSPAMFKRFSYPALKANVDFAHAKGLPFLHHACGNNWALLDFFMEAGIDCYQSIQASAGMDLAKVKECTYGRMAIWGGALVENLVSGTPEDVRENVRQALEIGAPGGGYIFGTSHSIAVGSTYDNVMAMFDTFVKYR
jgi:uroporphyrinogen-III decarboxylase